VENYWADIRSNVRPIPVDRDDHQLHEGRLSRLIPTFVQGRKTGYDQRLSLLDPFALGVIDGDQFHLLCLRRGVRVRSLERQCRGLPA